MEQEKAVGRNLVKTFNAGDTIFKEGDVGEFLYVLQAGVVELKKKVESGETVLKSIDKPNDFFGEMALIDGRPRSATAIAASTVRLMVVDGPTFETMILTNGKFALKIIKVLSDRIRYSNQRVEELIDTSPRDRIIFGMVDFALYKDDRLPDGAYRAKLKEMREWINGRMGISYDEIDACVFRLVKLETVIYIKGGARANEDLLLPAAFISQVNRPK